MRKPKGLLVCISVVAMAVLLLPVMLSCAPKTVSEQIILKFATMNPPVGMNADLYRWAGDELEKRTDGRVKVEYYFGGSLITLPEMLQGIKDGVADMGELSAAWFPAELALNSFNSMGTCLGPSVERLNDTTYTVEQGWKHWDDIPALHNELEQWNQTLWCVQPTLVRGLWSRVAINNLDDLSGLRVRELGMRGKIMFASLGAVPVAITPSELYGGLQKGTIDAAVVPLDWGKSRKLEEVGKYLVLVNMNSGLVIIPINMDTVNKLSKGDRDILFEVGRDLSMKFAETLSGMKEELFQGYREAGVTIIDFPDAERDKWRSMCEQNLSKAWLEEQEKSGVSSSDARVVIEHYLTAMGGADVIPK